jgi:hypothetical protein
MKYSGGLHNLALAIVTFLNVIARVEGFNKTVSTFSFESCFTSNATVCWPKCCFESQVFNLKKQRCQQANKTVILEKPNIYSLR